MAMPLSSKYSELKNSIENAINRLTQYKATFDSKLKAADPEGTNPDYNADREAAGQAQEIIDSIK